MYDIRSVAATSLPHVSIPRGAVGTAQFALVVVDKNNI